MEWQKWGNPGEANILSLNDCQKVRYLLVLFSKAMNIIHNSKISVLFLFVLKKIYKAIPKLLPSYYVDHKRYSNPWTSRRYQLSRTSRICMCE